MKFRTDFVTNSSSSSFIAYNYCNQELTSYLKSIGIVTVSMQAIKEIYCQMEDAEGSKYLQTIESDMQKIHDELEECYWDFEHADKDENLWDLSCRVIKAYDELKALSEPMKDIQVEKPGTYDSDEMAYYLYRNIIDAEKTIAYKGLIVLPGIKTAWKLNTYPSDYNYTLGSWGTPDQFSSISAWLVSCLLKSTYFQDEPDYLQELIKIFNDAKVTNVDLAQIETWDDESDINWQQELVSFDKFDQSMCGEEFFLFVHDQPEGDADEIYTYKLEDKKLVKKDGNDTWINDEINEYGGEEDEW